MWIRDSTNQISPYIRFVNEDPGLKDLVFGVIQVQASYLDYDPYANAFLRPWYAPPVENPRKGSTTDKVTPAYDPTIVWESKVKKNKKKNKKKDSRHLSFFNFAV